MFSVHDLKLQKSYSITRMRLQHFLHVSQPPATQQSSIMLNFFFSCIDVAMPFLQNRLCPVFGSVNKKKKKRKETKRKKTLNKSPYIQLYGSKNMSENYTHMHRSKIHNAQLTYDRTEYQRLRQMVMVVMRSQIISYLKAVQASKVTDFPPSMLCIQEFDFQTSKQMQENMRNNGNRSRLNINVQYEQTVYVCITNVYSTVFLKY